MEFLYGLINAINNFANAIIQLIGSDWTGTVSAFCSVISLIANANQGLNFPNKMVNIANATRPKICRSRP